MEMRDMKKRSNRKLCRLILSSGLVPALILLNTATVSALDEGMEEPGTETSTVIAADEQETPQAETVYAPVVSEPDAAYTPEYITEIPAEAVSETVQEYQPEAVPEALPVQEQPAEEEPAPASEEPAQEEPQEIIPEETPEPVQTVDAPEENVIPETEDTPEETTVAEAVDEEVPEQPAVRTVSANRSVPVLTAPAPAEESLTRAAGDDENTEETGDGENTQESEPTGMITIGTTEFSPEDTAEGTGWKNIAGQYVAMVDYDGRGQTVSMDGGTLTLAVAGVNRIGSLEGNCSVQIVGTGIVLIDSIGIDDGNTITLHSDTNLYSTGSAAVFVLQDDGNYLLINGGTPGILDEEYTLNGVKLRVPGGSSLVLGSAIVRTETWYDDGEQTDVTVYTDEMPHDAYNSSHGGNVEMEGHVGSVTIGADSTLTIDENATVTLKENTAIVGIVLTTFKAKLVVQGILCLDGDVEGGSIDVSDGGKVTGDGTISSAQVDLESGGTIAQEVLLDNSSLAILGSGTVTTPRIKDSIINLKGGDTTLPQVNASGTSYIGVNSEFAGTSDVEGSGAGSYTIVNITVNDGSLNIVCNDHNYAVFTSNEEPRYIEDCFLTISGTVSGNGKVNVLAGRVDYTGTGKDNIPTAPEGSLGRVFVTRAEAESAFNPLNMTAGTAAGYADTATIPVLYGYSTDTLISSDFLARAWYGGVYALDPLTRKDGHSYRDFTCDSLLELYNLKAYSYSPTDEDSHETETWEKCYSAVEVIYSDFTRIRCFAHDGMSFDTQDAILIRILNCSGEGGQAGGSSTDVSSNFTGNGSLGNTGTGSVTSGSGNVVYGVPAQPEPEEPDPVEPEPDNPEPDDKDDDNTTTDSSTAGSTGDTNTTASTADDTGWTDDTAVYTTAVTTAPVYRPQPTSAAYTVYFETYGGTEIEAQTVTAGTAAARPYDPKKEGYLFGGWYLDKEFTEAFDFLSPINGNTTVYAKWTEPEEITPAPVPAVPAEPVKKAGRSWLWILLVLLGAAGVGTGIAVTRKKDEDE